MSYGVTAGGAMPAGLSLDTFTGTISGTPSILVTPRLYTITGFNTGGSTSVIWNVTVIECESKLVFLWSFL